MHPARILTITTVTVATDDILKPSIIRADRVFAQKDHFLATETREFSPVPEKLDFMKLNSGAGKTCPLARPMGTSTQPLSV